jgi:hypothetical protein
MKFGHFASKSLQVIEPSMLVLRILSQDSTLLMIHLAREGTSVDNGIRAAPITKEED